MADSRLFWLLNLNASSWRNDMKDLEKLVNGLKDSGTKYKIKTYRRFTTVDVMGKSYDFHLGGKLIGAYSMKPSKSIRPAKSVGVKNV